MYLISKKNAVSLKILAERINHPGDVRAKARDRPINFIKEDEREKEGGGRRAREGKAGSESERARQIE